LKLPPNKIVDFIFVQVRRGKPEMQNHSAEDLESEDSEDEEDDAELSPFLSLVEDPA